MGEIRLKFTGEKVAVSKPHDVDLMGVEMLNNVIEEIKDVGRAVTSVGVEAATARPA